MAYESTTPAEATLPVYHDDVWSAVTQPLQTDTLDQEPTSAAVETPKEERGRHEPTFGETTWLILGLSFLCKVSIAFMEDYRC